MCVLRETCHDRIDKDHKSDPDIKAVQIDLMGTGKILSVDFGNILLCIREGLVVFQTIAFVFADPSLPLVHLDVVPAGAGRGCHKNQRGLVKGGHIIEMIFGTDIFQKLYQPGRIAGFSGHHGPCEKLCSTTWVAGLGRTDHSMT